MLAMIRSGAVIGVEAYPVDVEVDLGRGMMIFSTVGLPSSAVCESKTRVKSALVNSGFKFPQKRVVVNLAPAHIKKEGTAFDLPIALGILIANECAPEASFYETIVVGELSLDGRLRAVRGVLPLTAWAQRVGIKRILVPEENGVEAASVAGIEVWVARDLKEVIKVACGELKARYMLRAVCLAESPSTELPSTEPPSAELSSTEFLSTELPSAELPSTGLPSTELSSPQGSQGLTKSSLRPVIDLADVRGQEGARRALEIAAAGGHNLLFLGPPGSGKTMLARRLPTIVPPLSFNERLECSIIASVSGLLKPDRPLIEERPFRAPHHTLSQVALAGGGPQCRPGEVSLAHNGVLFLDELPEFRRSALETLRQPMEDGEIVIARAFASLSYPARFTLIAAMNPCPCGYYGDPKQVCQCNPNAIRNYLNRISGPLLDRIDLQVAVEAVDPLSLRQRAEGEASAVVRQRVCEARHLQSVRFKDAEIHSNGQMRPSELRIYCQLDEEAERLFSLSITRLGLSARAHDRVLKVARTIADLAGSAELRTAHIAEAIQYRQLDRVWSRQIA